ncbi:MAG: type II toxin-antitoxin system PemK/MazF family toxin [bacterium]|nr:type II toxin-antitoxin system PemK/MazF family toxin [bacterium]
MKKDFKKWHAQKQEVEKERPRVFFDEREIWSCYLGENVGFEQDGRGEEFLRPTVILKKFNNEVMWVIPLTRTKKKGKYYFSFSFGDETDISTAILSQIRLVDAKRLKYKMGVIKAEDFASLKSKIRHLIA